MYACIACMHVSMIIYIYMYVCVCARVYSQLIFGINMYQQPNSWITWWFGPRGVELQAYEIVQKTCGAC